MFKVIANAVAMLCRDLLWYGSVDSLSANFMMPYWDVFSECLTLLRYNGSTIDNYIIMNQISLCLSEEGERPFSFFHHALCVVGVHIPVSLLNVEITFLILDAHSSHGSSNAFESICDNI